jgi:hypothetical protein
LVVWGHCSEIVVTATHFPGRAALLAFAR